MPEAKLDAVLQAVPSARECWRRKFPPPASNRSSLMLAANRGEPAGRSAKSPAAANCRASCCAENRAGRARSGRHAHLRRDRRQRGRPARGHPRREAGGAGQDPSSHLRHPPPPGRQLREAISGPSARNARGKRTTTVIELLDEPPGSTNWPACCAARRAAKPRARKPRRCWRRHANVGEGCFSGTSFPRSQHFARTT